MAAPLAVASKAAFPWAAAATIAAPLLGGLLGGDRNGGLTGKIQRQSMRLQMGEFQKQSGLEDKMLGMVDHNAGLYDPGRYMANLNANDFRNEGLEAGALGAGAAAAGYRPGDSPVGDNFARLGEQHRIYRDNLATTLPLNLFNQQLGAYNAVRQPNASYLSSAANEAQNYTQPDNGIGQALAGYLQYSAMQPHGAAPQTTTTTTPGMTGFQLNPPGPNPQALGAPGYMTNPFPGVPPLSTGASPHFDIGSFGKQASGLWGQG